MQFANLKLVAYKQDFKTYKFKNSLNKGTSQKDLPETNGKYVKISEHTI